MGSSSVSSLLRLSIIAYSCKMLSYSVINLKLLQNIVFKLFLSEKQLAFFLLIIRTKWKIQHNFCPRELSAAGSVCTCLCPQWGRAGTEVFPHRARSFCQSRTTVLVCSNQKLVLFITRDLGKQVTMLTTCCFSVSLYQKINSYLVFKRTGQVTQSSEGNRVLPMERDCRNRFAILAQYSDVFPLRRHLPSKKATKQISSGTFCSPTRFFRLSEEG